MKYLYLLVTMGMVSMNCHPVDDIDWDDPEVIKAYEEVVLGIDERRFRGDYEIITDTLWLSTDTLMLLLTVVKDDEKVYDQVRYEVLCGG